MSTGAEVSMGSDVSVDFSAASEEPVVFKVFAEFMELIGPKVTMTSGPSMGFDLFPSLFLPLHARKYFSSPLHLSEAQKQALAPMAIDVHPLSSSSLYSLSVTPGTNYETLVS